MTPSQFAALDMLFNSGFKPAVWGSDKAGWRIGPHLVDTRTKKSLERQGWIQSEGTSADDGATVDRLVWTEEGRRAFIAAGGHPGAHGGRKARRRSQKRFFG